MKIIEINLKIKQNHITSTTENKATALKGPGKQMLQNLYNHTIP